MNRGWNGDTPAPQPPWSETKNYLDRDGKWKWQLQNEYPPNFALHWMWALSVPEGDHQRLSAWSQWNGIAAFYQYVKKDIETAGAKGKVALYMNTGLELFR